MIRSNAVHKASELTTPRHKGQSQRQANEFFDLIVYSLGCQLTTAPESAVDRKVAVDAIDGCVVSAHPPPNAFQATAVANEGSHWPAHG